MDVECDEKIGIIWNVDIEDSVVELDGLGYNWGDDWKSGEEKGNAEHS